jgi:hypothetical protein
VTRRRGRISTVAAVSAAAALLAPVTAAVARPLPGVGPLERHPVLRQLGVPRWSTLRTEPVFRTGFERPGDLAGFYATPQSPLTHHEVQVGGAHRGRRAHLAWLTGRAGVEPVDGPNHRGYPTIQLQKRPAGACQTPCLVQFWVRIDGWDLHRGEWLSLATLSPDASDRWARVVTVNVGWEGWLHLFHVPTQGAGQRAFQRTDLPFPSGRWVRVTVWLDLQPEHGAAAVWQDGRLVSAARVSGGDGSLDQLHFGLYASPALTHGVVRNDDIKVVRVRP